MVSSSKRKKIQIPANMSWLTSDLIQKSSYTMSKYKEIPRVIPEFSPHLENLDNFTSHKILAELNNIVSSESLLLLQEIELIQKRFSGRLQYNIFDLFVTNGDSAVPFVFELLNGNSLNKYYSVTHNQTMNTHAISKLQAFVDTMNIKGFKAGKILANLEVRDFKTELYQETLKDPKNTSNIFILSNSLLGNSIYPENLIHNIYKSMNSGDHLIVIQGIYRKGTEDLLVADYSRLFGEMKDTSDVAKLINPNAEFKFTWDDRETEKGVKITFKNEENVLFGSAQFDENDEITLFRSRRFERHSLENTFVDCGFRIVQISLDENMDTALFLLQK